MPNFTSQENEIFTLVFNVLTPGEALNYANMGIGNQNPVGEDEITEVLNLIQTRQTMNLLQLKVFFRIMKYISASSMQSKIQFTYPALNITRNQIQGLFYRLYNELDVLIAQNT